MHLRGVLDNYAWSYLYEKEPDLKLPKSQIGLFSEKMTKASKNQAFWNFLAPYRQWAKDLADKRDPVTHRIPLTISPSLLSKEDVKKYREYEEMQNLAFKDLDFEKLEDLSTRQRALGTFPMVFAHNPFEQATPIYPTIPSDMANLIGIHRLVLNELAKKPFN